MKAVRALYYVARWMILRGVWISREAYLRFRKPVSILMDPAPLSHSADRSAADHFVRATKHVNLPAAERL